MVKLLELVSTDSDFCQDRRIKRSLRPSGLPISKSLRGVEKITKIVLTAICKFTSSGENNQRDATSVAASLSCCAHPWKNIIAL